MMHMLLMGAMPFAGTVGAVSFLMPSSSFTEVMLRSMTGLLSFRSSLKIGKISSAASTMQIVGGAMVRTLAAIFRHFIFVIHDMFSSLNYYGT